MGGSISPNTTQRVSYEESPYQKWLRGVITNPNSAVSLGLKDAAQQAKLAMGVKAGDPKALKKFWGYQPTKEDFAAMQSGGTDFYRGVSQASKNTSGTKTAAHGGLMSLRGYAPGGTTETAEQKANRLRALVSSGKKLNTEQNNFLKNYTATVNAGGTPSSANGKDANAVGNKGLDDSQAAFVQQMAKLMQNGEELTQAQQDRLNRIEQKTGRNVSPYTDVGTITPSNPKIAKAAEQIQSSYTQTKANPPGEGQTTYSPAQAMYGQVSGYDPKQQAYGGITNEYGQKAIDTAMNMQMPEEYNQASGYYNTAAQGLQGLANYQAQNVSAQQATAQNAAAQQASAAQMGNIADVSAERASAQQATAAQMGNIADVKAERAAAERAASSRMGNIADVNAQQVDLGKYNIDASKMGKAKDVEAQQLERYQMGDTAPVTTQDLTAYQMEGPGSWTDEGVSSKYMSPYMQGVIDISKREAERDYLKQMNALNAKAMSAGAFGGSRQALERSEAQRNYNQQLQDIQVKGLQQAYESGRSQYGQELSLSQQAALQNLQSKLSTQSQSSQQALQAMLSNQSIDYQTKLQNLQAMLGVQSQEAQQMLNASLANQQSENLYNQTNAQLAQQAALANQGVNTQGALANQQAALQAALANQQTQFGVGSLNANLEQQAALQNAQLGTQTNLANQQAALNAALANQQTQFGVGSLNANLANQVGLQNASLGTQANLANQQAALQAALANQQTQFGVGSLNANLANQVNLQNANLGTQAAMQNAQLGTQTSWQNAANALQASMANQAAGLQSNQQNIAAYGAMGNMAGGLGSIGSNRLAGEQQLLGNIAQIYNTTDAKQQQWLNTQQQNAINQQMGVQNAAKFGIPSGAPMVTGGGAQVSQAQV